MFTFNSSITRSWRERLSSFWLQARLVVWQTGERPRLCRNSAAWPAFARRCPVCKELTPLLRLLDWNCLPTTERQWFGREPVSLAAYVGAFLVKLEHSLPTMAHLRRFLVAHPALVWALGFPLQVGSGAYPFDPEASLPGHRHFSRVLRCLPNELLQHLLDGQVTDLQRLLPANFGQTVSLDTKHILAWVKENNRKAYIKERRFDKAQQPAGDPDCKLGCKRRHNRIIPTPTTEGLPAQELSLSVGEFYWGYASGAVVTKVPGWGEFVLAEMTQPFDQGDTTYFFPLMAQVERRLGFRPRYGALDAGFDAFYIYDHFHNPQHDGFAAVPFSRKGGKPERRFDEIGAPLCDAGLPMHHKFSYNDRTTAIIPYRRAKYVCPLLHPQPNGQSCPIDHKRWPKGGCATHLADTPGARIRHQLDRQSQSYKTVYSQRTAVERIFAQAVNLGIERPKLRNGQAIANQNTLLYLLINLRSLRRVHSRLTDINS